MINNVQLFNYLGQDVRTLDVDGQILFVGVDSCKVLDISDYIQAIERLDDDERGRYIVPTPGGPQQMLCITESGLYHLIFTSRKPEAKVFRRWVTGEVLPAIRQTGSYSLNCGDMSGAGKPPSFKRGMRAPFLLWGLGTGVFVL
jgi:prophage antirepressor-like protein